MLYQLGRSLCRTYFRLFFRWEIKGAEHIPADGPVVICCNHIDNMDPPLLGSSISRKVHFMAKKELFSVPLLGPILPRLGAYPVSRGAGDKGALRKSLELLKEGKVLGIFPEGTRSKNGQLGKGRTGAAFIALRSDSVIVPAAVTGPYRKFQRIKITFGKPIDLTPYRAKGINSETVEEVMEKTMNEIAALLPINPPN
ncbi:lysophospholipid acyltransferase family protein [Marininema halotolerans]|uniref:1-acyl-sn-glycerol-3-phosphate acyltransferase n=1 Tax=Marininema halotolerans TaxID=1155944 RepID=A0A1I6TY53_9BACL|nr:lysophospholipid acyltransferase family protein [Marininema halotolerans]SFS94100.1 1-acyl-sn-glycerol-3-phosphate acyltransferase [Marininema halotolerans]